MGNEGERRLIAIVDYGAGNLRSIQKALEHVSGPEAGLDVVITGDPQVLERAAAVVLPGVGAAGATMRHLAGAGLIDPLRRAARSGRPFLGVCLGLQLLFAHHEEDDVPGLGVLAGHSRRLPGGLKVPHMGWNTVHPSGPAWATMSGDAETSRPAAEASNSQPDSAPPAHATRNTQHATPVPIPHPLSPIAHYYFVHSYYVEPAAALAGAVAGTTAYGLEFCSALVYETIWATQFHPEKSGPAGLRLLANFVRQVAP